MSASFPKTDASGARCRACSVQATCFVGVLPESARQRLAVHLKMVSCPSGGTLAAQGDAAEWVYMLVEGAVRQVRTNHDGEREVIGFHGPGEIVGVPRDGAYLASVEAMNAVKACRIPRRQLTNVSDNASGLKDRILTIAQSSFHSALAQNAMLRQKSALAKVCAFILFFAKRCAKVHDHDCIDLPMRRDDIGAFLGVASETVSRCMTQLARENILQFETAHHARICDRHALETYAHESDPAPG